MTVSHVGRLSVWATLPVVLAATPLRAAERLAPPSADTASPAAVAPPPATSEQIATWIDELRHDSYAVRQAAARQLLTAGAAARAPLETAANAADPEVRAAARRLVALIEKVEFDQRLAAFAADTEGKQGLTLPGWESFQKLIGSDQAARLLFVEMQRSESATLAAVFSGDLADDGPSWEDRLMRLLRWPATADVRSASPPLGSDVRSASPPLGSCATMVFLGLVPEVEMSDRTVTYIPQLMQRPPILHALHGTDRRDAVRRLVVAWIIGCPNRSHVVLQERLNLAMAHEMREAVPLALDVARMEPRFLTVNPTLRAGALLLISQLGTRSDAEKLEPLLEDTSVCLTLGAPQVGQFGQPGVAQPGLMVRDVQIRDVALATMLRLTNQDPAEYGFPPNRRTQQQIDLSSLSFESDAERSRAAEKWRNWKAGQGRATPQPLPAN